MFKTIGILAHVDAGKTTFSEQLLFHTNTIRQRGRVDHRDSFLDTHTIERDRGITIFADQATFTFKESTYFLIDTPGHVDFSPEMERAIQAMDYAIIVVSAIEGVEGHTETVWQLLRKHQIPTFFFINKTDYMDTNPTKVLQEIQENLSSEVCNINGLYTEELIEFIAERDEALLDIYMESGFNEELWNEAFQKMIRRGEVFPCASGSALKDIGVLEFLDSLDKLTETSYSPEDDFVARAYKIRHDENGSRITFLKVLNGSLRVRDEITYRDTKEKVTQLRTYNGPKFKAVDQASAGELIGVVGLSDVSIGEMIGIKQAQASFDSIPTLTSMVQFDPSIHVKDVLRYFKLLDAEDPSLSVVWEERLQEIHVHVMGVIQLEVLTQIMKERFSIDVTFGKPKILYKETIEEPIKGYGHFEPLKHYAEVHLLIEPAPRGSGVSFYNVCHSNDLSIGNQNLVKHHLLEKDHHGILTGSALTDVKITLLTGRGHNEHTSGGDFREASYRALRQGLEKAKNRILEPYYDYKIKVEMDLIGRVLSDIQQANGTFEPPENVGDKVVVKGKVPVATFMNYSTTFASYTHGKGIISLLFSGYDRCHNPEEVIEQIGYNKEADPDYTSTSIFCAKGTGYKVPWYEAEAAMHCLK